jgi:Txe/YoeB family toxin of Txe-Axe toxin-antitoxin module
MLFSRCRNSLVLVALLGLASTGYAQNVDSVTCDEYQNFMAWKDGIQDPRLAEDSDDERYKKISKTIGLSAEDLKAVVGKIEPLQGKLKGAWESKIKQSLAQTPVNAQVKSVEMNVQTGSPIAYIEYACGETAKIDRDATWVAEAVRASGGFVKTLALWCTDTKGIKQFSAIIDRSGFEKIRKSSIDRFASSRYIRLFTDIKRGPHT